MMASTSKIVLMTLAIVVTETAHGNVKSLDLDEGFTLKPDSKEDGLSDNSRVHVHVHSPTIGRFVSHSVCRTIRGKFEALVAKRLNHMNESSVKDLVKNLCHEKKRTLLKLWVAEIFDADGDGKINFHEKGQALFKIYDN